MSKRVLFVVELQTDTDTWEPADSWGDEAAAKESCRRKLERHPGWQYRVTKYVPEKP